AARRSARRCAHSTNSSRSARSARLSSPGCSATGRRPGARTGGGAAQPRGADWRAFDQPRDDLTRTANSRPPVKLAELAITVATGYAAGDPAAIAIAERAADLLIGTVRRVRPPATTGPLVLAGSVAGEASPGGRLLPG